MIVELHESVVNAAIGCIKELNSKEGNSLEKSTGYINLYNALDGGIAAAKNKEAEQQKASIEAKKQMGAEAVAAKGKAAKTPVKGTDPKLLKEDTAVMDAEPETKAKK